MTQTATFPDLNGQSVFITGGGNGIGATLTDQFLAQGANVAFIGRSDASEFVAEMQAKHGRAPLFLQGDITNTDQLQSIMRKAGDAHGPITIHINNAANDERHKLDEVTDEYWDKSMAVNLKSYFFACQEAARQMKTAGFGSIINFSSASYLMGMPDFPAYTTANAGITALSRTLARDLGPDKIRVNAVSPGWVMTPKQLDMWATPQSLADCLATQCLKTHLVPQDIADVVLFLASNSSRMMTGQLVAVDGGVVITG